MNINFEKQISIKSEIKKSLTKYFEHPESNLIKLNKENIFIIYNKNINSSISIIKLDISKREETIADFEEFEIVFNFDQIFGVYFYLDKLYLINSLNLVYLIYLKSEKKTVHKIKIENEQNENLELFDFSAYGIVNPKIIFSGGINLKGILNNNLYSFDISTYKFELNKVKENNLIGRYKHGMFVEEDYIYIIGGFMKFIQNENDINENNEKEYICDKIQLIKFDNLMENWMEVDFNGPKPRLMIDPYIQIVNKRYLFSFSKFKYEKIWYLDILTNTASIIDVFASCKIPRNLRLFNGFFFDDNEQSFIVFHPIYDYIENKNKITLNENSFDFVVKFYYPQEIV